MSGARRIRDEPDPEIEKMLEEDAGKGVSLKVADRASWLDDIDDPDAAPWYEALADIDREKAQTKSKRAKGKKDPDKAKTALIALLRSKRPLPFAVRWHIADLHERYTLKNKPGPRRTPSYDRTSRQAMMEMALDNMRGAVRYGKMRVKEAADYYANESVSADKLEDAYRGKSASWRRLKKRQPKK